MKLESTNQKLMVLAYLVASVILLIQIIPTAHQGGFSWQNVAYLLGGLIAVWVGVLLAAKKLTITKAGGWVILLTSFLILVSRILINLNIITN